MYYLCIYISIYLTAYLSIYLSSGLDPVWRPPWWSGGRQPGGIVLDPGLPRHLPGRGLLGQGDHHKAIHVHVVRGDVKKVHNLAECAAKGQNPFLTSSLSYYVFFHVACFPPVFIFSSFPLIAIFYDKLLGYYSSLCLILFFVKSSLKDYFS